MKAEMILTAGKVVITVSKNVVMLDKIIVKFL